MQKYFCLSSGVLCVFGKNKNQNTKNEEKFYSYMEQRCRKIREKEEKLNSDLKIFDHAKYWITITCRKLDDFR